MRYYLYPAILIAVSVALILLLPQLFNLSEKALVRLEIPANNSAVAGVQKFNIPPVGKNLPPPSLTARSVIVKDLGSGMVLYQKDANIKLPIASTTKIMTALISSKYFKPNFILTVKQGAEINGSKVGLVKGEELTFRSLLYGMLLNSGNDAAYSIAENYPGGVVGFVSAMNKEASTLNLSNTHFDNPAGFDSPSHYSSAADLSKISEEALKDPQLARVFATKETEVVSWDKKYKHELHNLNKLLSQVSGVLGVKTGFTQQAKENLVTLVDRDSRRILTVVLGSDDRFGESTKLIEWVYSNFDWSGF